MDLGGLTGASVKDVGVTTTAATVQRDQHGGGIPRRSLRGHDARHASAQPGDHAGLGHDRDGGFELDR